MGRCLYIAGPMTGYPDLNYPAFFDAAKQLRKAGYRIINPARTEGREHCKTWLDFMRCSLRDLADCEGIAVLPGWADSSGAALEVQIAHGLHLPVATVTEWIMRRSN